MVRDDIYRAVDAERQRQDDRFGPQCYAWPIWAAILGEECGEVAEASLQAHWCEAYSAGDERLLHLREELIQVAAVAVHTVEKIDSGEYPEPIPHTGRA